MSGSWNLSVTLNIIIEELNRCNRRLAVTIDRIAVVEDLPCDEEQPIDEVGNVLNRLEVLSGLLYDIPNHLRTNHKKGCEMVFNNREAMDAYYAEERP